MNKNLIDELNSDSKYKSTYNNSDYISSHSGQQDNDSTSSFLNLIDQEMLNNQMSGDTFSPNYTLSESTNNSSNEQLAKPDVKSNSLDSNFEELMLSKLPQIVAIERASIQYQVIDPSYPSLSKSFQNCFNTPVLDLLVVVLDSNKLVSFFQGFFAGTPRLTNELIDFIGKYWKSFISNNDDNAWENHFRSVEEKHNSKPGYDPEFEVGPVIRCRLRSSSNPQFNQQFNYFFVQPCSYIIELPSNNFLTNSMDFNSMDTNSGGINNYFVSYINIVRECDTEYALKGSAAASLQKVITNSTCIQRQKMDNMIDTSNNKQTNNRYFRRTIHNIPMTINNQLSVNISSPAYSNIEQSPIPASTPLTYPLINNHRSDQYNKTSLFTGAQIQHQISVQMNHHPYMARGPSMSNVDPNQHRYSGPYDSSSHSSLQYILENRNNNYQNVKQLSNPTHVMGHGQLYKNPIQSNSTYFIPTAQSAQQNCSLNSPSSFMSGRHVIQMPSNSILMSSDQYFRSGHQINMMDSVQSAQPMMTVVQPMSAASTHSPANYYYSTAQNQILHNPLHINTSMTNQSQFVSSSVSPYCNSERSSMTHQEYTNTSSRTNHQNSIKEENYDICQNDWMSNALLDSQNSSMMPNNSISIDIVEEILQAEEAKAENISVDNDPIKSDSSESLMGYLNDFMVIHDNNTPTSNVPVSVPSPKLLNLDSIKSEGKASDFQLNKFPSSKAAINSQIVNSDANLRAEVLKNLDSSKRLQIKKIVHQYQTGKIKRVQMCQQINRFLNQALGSRMYSQQVLKFWNSQQQFPLNDNVDSSLSGFNYSHIVQSPEEGPGISPTEQAAQSTTDLEDDKEAIKCTPKVQSNRFVDKTNNEFSKKLGRSKSNTKNSEASIYSISSTTSTGVLETLLNEHDNHLIPDKSVNSVVSNNITNSKLPISSTSKNQLSLDQLLMDDDFSMFPNTDEKITKRTSESVSVRNMNSKPNKSQPSTPLVSNNMGVLETLLNQKTPSVSNLRQMSTENILKHSKPSRQNSCDLFTDETNNSFDPFDKDRDKNLKKNSLLITLLNTSQNSEKGKLLNSSVSLDGSSTNLPNKRCRILSGTQSLFDNSTCNKKTDEKLISPGVDVFDFDNELSYCTTDTQSTVVTSSQPQSARKKGPAKRGRKRRYSKDRSIDSDESSDRLSSIGEKYMKVSSLNSKLEDKNVILTALLENKKFRDNASLSQGKSVMNSEKSDEFSQSNIMYDSQMATDDNIDLEDIKIDDFDLDNLIDISENYDESNSVITELPDPQLNINSNLSNSEPNVLTNKPIVTNSTNNSSNFDLMPPVYKMVGPVIKSDPIVPMSKQSVIRVSDKNSILLSAIQSTSTSNAISFECLDSERERLLRQQQQQKVSMGGDKPPVTMSHQLSLDMLSKQMKEVGPNVMVELSGPSDVSRSRKCSISKSQSGISSLSTCNPSGTLSNSPTCRSSYQSTCSIDNSIDSNKVAHTTTNLNHQQVREGLRLLVSTRSAQNTSKNTSMQMHRASNVNLNEMNPQTDGIISSKTSVKDVIHYTPNLQAPNSHKELAYPYTNQSYSSNINVVNDSKTADILEDSLVNDVFGLEELVNSKSRLPSASMDYPKLNNQESFNNEIQLESSNLSSVGSQQHSSSHAYSHSKVPHHHHHHTHHYHHHHHHHAHPVSNPPSVNDSNITTTKEKQNVNSGLLETLLSR